MAENTGINSVPKIPFNISRVTGIHSNSSSKTTVATIRKSVPGVKKWASIPACADVECVAATGLVPVIGDVMD